MFTTLLANATKKAKRDDGQGYVDTEPLGGYSPLTLESFQPPKEMNKCSRSLEVLGNQQRILIKSNLLIRYILNVIITQ